MTAIFFEHSPVPYDGQWPTLFAKLSREIRDACVPYAAIEKLDHIGSTSIAGLTAKPILDLLIELRPGMRYAEQLTRTLSAGGFVAKGENGITGRLYVTRPERGPTPAVHIHAFATGHAELTKHLAFRDYLRATPKAANDYATLKSKLLAVDGVTRETYQEGKASFLQSTTKEALTWYTTHDLKEGRKRKPKKKVVVYVTRKNGRGETELLVFDHLHPTFADVNPQVPSGSVDKSEEIPLAAERELYEEAGIELELAMLGSYVYYKPHLDRFQDRHHFLGQVTKSMPDTWTHSVTGHGNDKDLVFKYYWLPLAQARETLRVDLGRGLDYFNVK